MNQDTVYPIPKTLSESLRLNAVLMIDMAEKVEENEELTKDNVEMANYITENKSTIELFDTLTDTNKVLSMRELAICLNIPTMGRDKLMTALKSPTFDCLAKDNNPYQHRINSGHFVAKMVNINKGNNKIETYIQPFVTMKGALLVFNKCKKAGFPVGVSKDEFMETVKKYLK